MNLHELAMKLYVGYLTSSHPEGHPQGKTLDSDMELDPQGMWTKWKHWNPDNPSEHWMSLGNATEKGLERVAGHRYRDTFSEHKRLARECYDQAQEFLNYQKEVIANEEDVTKELPNSLELDNDFF